ncbi:hypothetical protein CPB85DRAFT_1304064 [Mucidula mucida]|nr:hypothetical protein CPB85DRAFT_1304064 [Mucidula mucida]
MIGSADVCHPSSPSSRNITSTTFLGTWPAELSRLRGQRALSSLCRCHFLARGLCASASLGRWES